MKQKPEIDLFTCYENSYPIHDRSVAFTGNMDGKSVWKNYFYKGKTQEKDCYLYADYFNN